MIFNVECNTRKKLLKRMYRLQYFREVQIMQQSTKENDSFGVQCYKNQLKLKWSDEM